MSATVWSEIHFQKTTGSCKCTDLSFDLFSRLKIWR